MTETKRQLTPSEINLYINGGGIKCPYCGSEDIHGSGSEPTTVQGMNSP